MEAFDAGWPRNWLREGRHPGPALDPHMDALSSRQVVRVFQELRLRRRPAEDAMKEFLDCL